MGIVTEDNLADELVGWEHDCNIPSLHIARLLEILHKYLPSLPKDPRTLLETERNMSVRKLADGGTRHHFGIINMLKSLWNQSQLKLPPNTQQLLLQINVDGLQLFKSSDYQFWLILAMFLKLAFMVVIANL